MDLKLFPTLFAISLLLLLGFIKSTDQTTLLACVFSNSAGPQLACGGPNQLIWVDQAYLGRTLSDPTPPPSSSYSPSFCDALTINPARGDCLSSVDDVTDDANKKCALYQTCRLNVDYSLINCSSFYAGSTYLYAEYECLTTQTNGVNIPFAIISQTQVMSNQPGTAFFRTADFPSSWTGLRGACRIQIPPQTRASWRILDLRGRLINLPPGCAYNLRIYSKTSTRSWCGQLTWTPVQYDHISSDSINVLFEPRNGQSSEGKLLMSLTLTNTYGDPVHGVNITCGQDLVLDVPPMTATPQRTSSTTTMLLPAMSDSTTSTTTTTTTTTTISTTPGVVTLLSSPAVVATSFPSFPTSGLPEPVWNTTSSLNDTFQENVTKLDTNPNPNLNDGNNSKDNTVWLIIGLTVGGGLFLIVIIIVVISICGYRKRVREAQKQNRVLFAWERAPGATAASADKNGTSPDARTKVNTYCREPQPDGFREFSVAEANRTAAWATEDRQSKRNHKGKDRTSKQTDMHLNPVYGQISLSNYVVPLDGVQTTAVI